MIYKLNSPYFLRGWEKMTCALVGKHNRVKPLKQSEFQTLLLCDGETELDADMLTAEMEEILDQYLGKKIICRIEESKPLEDWQQYRYYHNRYVPSIFWSVTGRCNFRCRHCYMDAPEGALGELSTEEALDLIDQMADCGVLAVDITGGEPFVRRDFWQLIDRIVAHHMVIGQVYTNGWLLNDHVLDEFERRGLKPEFSISFDGVGWHDWMRGIPGAEPQTLKALRLCRDRGFATDVEMCLHKGNLHTISDTIRVLKEAGVLAIKASNVSMTELWCKNSEGMALTDREYVEAMIEYIPEFFRAGRPIKLMLSAVIDLYPENWHGKKDNDPKYSVIPERYSGGEDCLDCHLCGAIRSSCYVTPDGRLLPCMPMTAAPAADQVKFPLIREIGLRKGLSDSFFMEYVDYRVKDLLEKNKECGQCPHRLKCGGGCRAHALLEGDHDLMGADRMLCMLWNEGYVERIRQTAEDAIAKYCPET